MHIERGRGAPAATGSWMLPPPEGQVPGRNSPCSFPVLRNCGPLERASSAVIPLRRGGPPWCVLASGGIPRGPPPD